MALSKSKLAAVQRELAKLLRAEERSGQGADWLSVWRLHDIERRVTELLPREMPARRAVATALMVEKEAARLGVSGPELADALTHLRRCIATLTHPPEWLTGGYPAAVVEMTTDAQAKARGIVLTAMGVPPGKLGPHPPGGRPNPEQTEMPGWFGALAAELASADVKEPAPAKAVPPEEEAAGVNTVLPA